MSITTHPVLLTAFLPLLLSTAIASPTRAQEGSDPLPETRKRLEIEAQRVEKEFRDGRLHAYRLVQSDPEQVAAAVERINTLRDMVERDQSLSADRRAVLLITLKADVRELENRAARARAARVPDPATRVARDDVRRTADARQETARKAHDDTQSRLDTMRTRVADARGARDRAGDAYLGANTSVDRSATPEAGDYVLPRDWAEKSTKRSPAAQLTAKEKALLEALQKPISVEFKDTPFQDVLDQLRRVTGQEIGVDKQALIDVNVNYDSPITFQVNKITTRTVLKRVLGDLGLTYIIKDGEILVTSVARAKETVSTRTYYVGDLAGVTDIRFGPYLSRIQAAQAIANIVNLITSQIDPQSWKVNNPDAPGVIVFDSATMTLIIKQTAEFHMMMGGGH